MVFPARADSYVYARKCQNPCGVLTLKRLSVRIHPSRPDRDPQRHALRGLFPVMFFKWISDSWDHERARAVDDFNDALTDEIEADYHRTAQSGRRRSTSSSCGLVAHRSSCRGRRIISDPSGRSGRLSSGLSGCRNSCKKMASLTHSTTSRAGPVLGSFQYVAGQPRPRFGEFV